MLLLGFYSSKKDVHDELSFFMSTDFYMAVNSKTPMFWIFPWWNLTTPCLPFYCGFILDCGAHSGVEFELTTCIFEGDLFLMSTYFSMALNSNTPKFWTFPWWNLTTPCPPFYCGFTLDRSRHYYFLCQLILYDCKL